MTSCNKITLDKNCNITIADDSFVNGYVQLFVLQNSNGSRTFVKESSDQKIVFSKIQDGYYDIHRLNIPLDETQPIYYKNGRCYHNVQEICWQDVFEMPFEISKIEKESESYFCTCNLRKCYIKACQNIFKQQTSTCNKQNIDSSLTYKRDLIWSALNVINYMVEMDQMKEAQRLLEEITGCNGLCSSENNFNNCGCGK